MSCLSRIARTRFVQEAIADRADLSAFRKKPSPRVIAGIAAICLSYVVGWPAVAVLGAVSIHVDEPLIFAIGGPVTYGLSHLVFIAGMYLAGAQYSKIFFRWATRMAVERLIIGSHKGERGKP
jgi:hypothetical protein